MALRYLWFEEDNLMSKNAIADLDMWKAQAEEVMKTKQSIASIYYCLSSRTRCQRVQNKCTMN